MRAAFLALSFLHNSRENGGTNSSSHFDEKLSFDNTPQYNYTGSRNDLCPIENIYSHFLKIGYQNGFFGRVPFLHSWSNLYSVVWVIVDPPSKKTLDVVGESVREENRATQIQVPKIM